MSADTFIILKALTFVFILLASTARSAGPAPADMDKLPLELLEDIFVLACRDGGRTGCALSLVSAHIRAVSRAIRFHIICLSPSTPLRISKLLSCVEKERDAGRELGRVPKIKHLAVVPWGPCIHSSDEDSDSESSEEFQRAEPIARPTTADKDSYATDLTALLRLAAPDLETLCFANRVTAHCFPTSIALSDADCGTGGFPTLRELILVGSYPFVDSVDDSTAIAMPRLGRLHLVIPRFGSQTTGMELSLWAKRAPRLTHLRLSNVMGLPEGMDQVLSASLAPRPSPVPF